MTKAALSAPAPQPAGQNSARAMARLIRMLLAADQPIEAAADGDMRVGAEKRAFSAALVSEAVSRGLACRTDNRLAATKEARAFLRRAAIEAEEAHAGQHRTIELATVEIDGARHPVKRNLDESPLSTLSRLKDREGRPFFPSEAIDAGDRLLADFTRAQLQPRVTASWEPRLSARAKGGAGGMAEIAAAAMEARRRFARAMDALGPELAGVAVDVCCFSKGLELVERERQWPVRSAKLMLRTALLALSRHYAPPPVRRSGHHWGAEDFRPAGQAFGTTGR